VVDKNSKAFLDQSQENFLKFMQEGTTLSAQLETANPVLAKLVDELMELGMRIRTLRQYCLNGSDGGKVNAERVIQILDGA
jgi:hypothetical protein